MAALSPRDQYSEEPKKHLILSILYILVKTNEEFKTRIRRIFRIRNKTP